MGCVLLVLLAGDGALSLFDGETTFGWKVEGEAKVEKGKLVLGGTKATKAEAATWFAQYRGRLEFTREGEGLVKCSLADKDFLPAGFATTLVADFGSKDGVKPHSPIRLEIPAGATVRVSKATLTPHVPKALFDGKTLAGWKAFTADPNRSKSKFTAKDGELHVKDGPGDFATEKLLDDFVLQLECKTNGKHLNSGVFFRAIPGEYQNGYEAQIHNDFTADPPKKYTVGKREMLSPAKDFGTGAIYRRVPARKAVAKDGEWFTMTVVARGRHLATWVNGVQQVDWTDDRPADDNPRKGYRERAGAISLQGHDPTTDLSFRNLRYAALKRE